MVAVLLVFSGKREAASSKPPRPATNDEEHTAPSVTTRPPPPKIPVAAPASPQEHAPKPSPRKSAPRAEDASENALMKRLRSIASTDPAEAVTLAREGNRFYPDSSDAPERTSILIHALAARGDSAEARGEAEKMVNQMSDSKWVREVERFTGAHRHRNARVNDAGQLELYDPPRQ